MSRIGSALLWWVLPGTAAVLVCLYVGLAVARHVNPPLVPVMGTSMNPLLHTGDIVLLRKADPAKLHRGTIIAFRTVTTVQKRYGVPATYVHRIVAVEKGTNGYQFRTKGDNVSGPDPFWTTQGNVIGVYDGSIPKIGFPVLFFRSKQGMILLAAIAFVALLYFLLGMLERRADFQEANAVTLSAIVDEARALRDSMLGAVGAPRAPPVASEPTGPRMVEVRGAPAEGAVTCSRGCHALLPGAKFDPHNGEPVDVPEPEAEPVPVSAPAEQFVPIPSSRALVPYVAPGFDFEQLEREIHEAVRSSVDVHETMKDLVGAIGEYGEHLRSHTAVIQNLAGATSELKQATSEMRALLASLTTVLADLVEQPSRSGRDAPA